MPGSAAPENLSCATASAESAQVRRMRGVLFDLDGTLLDTLELIQRSFDHACEQVLGARKPIDGFKELLGRPLGEQLAVYAGGSADVLERLLSTYREHNHLIEREAIRIFDGMEEALNALGNAGWKLGIVTSKTHATAQSNLDVFGLGPLFGTLVGYDDVEHPKPHPQSVQVGAENLGLLPQECFYVGDSPFDMQAGAGAGCVTVAALWGQHPRERLLGAGPDLLCEAVADLPALLEDRRG